MAYWEDEEERDEYDEEPREIATNALTVPGNCCICNRPGCGYGCFRCGRPVCYSSKDYFSDSKCGGWILDTWHPSHPDENEFYCQICLTAGLIENEGVSLADGAVKFKYDSPGVLQMTLNGATQALSDEDAKKLVAYLYDQRGELFGKPYNPDAEDNEPATDPFVKVGAGADDTDLDLDLEDNPFSL